MKKFTTPHKDHPLFILPRMRERKEVGVRAPLLCGEYYLVSRAP